MEQNNSKKLNNKLLKIFNDNKHVKHILKNDDIKKMCFIEGRYPFTKLPVCNNCEGLAMWHKDTFDNLIAYCTKCHTVSKNPMPYSEYLVDGYDIDSTGKAFRELSENEKTKLAKKRLLYIV